MLFLCSSWTIAMFPRSCGAEVLSINIWRCLLIHFNSSCQLKTSKTFLWICSPRYGGCKLRVFLSQRMEPCFFYSSNKLCELAQLCAAVQSSLYLAEARKWNAIFFFQFFFTCSFSLPKNALLTRNLCSSINGKLNENLNVSWHL